MSQQSQTAVTAISRSTYHKDGMVSTAFVINSFFIMLNCCSTDTGDNMNYTPCVLKPCFIHFLNACTTTTYDLLWKMITAVINVKQQRITTVLLGHFGGSLRSHSLEWYWQINQYRKIHKLNITKKDKQYKIQQKQNKTTQVQSSLTTLGQETWWAYSTNNPKPKWGVLLANK